RGDEPRLRPLERQVELALVARRALLVLGPLGDLVSVARDERRQLDPGVVEQRADALALSRVEVVDVTGPARVHGDLDPVVADPRQVADRLVERQLLGAPGREAEL